MSRLWVEQTLADGFGDALLVPTVGIVAFLRAVSLAAGQAAESSRGGKELLSLPHQVTKLAPQLARLEGLVARRRLAAQRGVRRARVAVVTGPL